MPPPTLYMCFFSCHWWHLSKSPQVLSAPFCPFGSMPTAEAIHPCILRRERKRERERERRMMKIKVHNLCSQLECLQIKSQGTNKKKGILNSDNQRWIKAKGGVFGMEAGAPHSATVVLCRVQSLCLPSRLVLRRWRAHVAGGEEGAVFMDALSSHYFFSIISNIFSLFFQALWCNTLGHLHEIKGWVLSVLMWRVM